VLCLRPCLAGVARGRLSDVGHDVHRPEEPLAPARGCLFGLIAASALWALIGLLVLGLFELGALATAALATAAVGGTAVVAGAVVAARRLGDRKGGGGLASGTGQPATDRDHAFATRAARRADDDF
jgi:hypothetical protein